MSVVTGVDERCWIIALFIRSDGERMVLGDGWYDFKEKQQHFAPNTIDSTVIDVQGGDGSLLSGQVRRASAQNFDGYVGDATCQKSDIETHRRKFINFFATNYFYEVVYVFADGTAVKRQRGFIVEAPSVEELWQIHPEYHVALSFEDVNYYNYLEDEDGNEIFGQKIIMQPATSTVGGFVWDSTGLVWDNNGAVCEGGSTGNTVFQNNSASNIYPIWTIYGPSSEPQLENLTTGETLKITGHNTPPSYGDFAIQSGQKIVVNLIEQTATFYAGEDDVKGMNILNYLQGDWVSLKPGRNELAYNTGNQNAVDSTLEWAEVVF